MAQQQLQRVQGSSAAAHIQQTRGSRGENCSLESLSLPLLRPQQDVCLRNQKCCHQKQALLHSPDPQLTAVASRHTAFQDKLPAEAKSARQEPSSRATTHSPHLPTPCFSTLCSLVPPGEKETSPAFCSPRNDTMSRKHNLQQQGTHKITDTRRLCCPALSTLPIRLPASCNT